MKRLTRCAIVAIAFAALTACGGVEQGEIAGESTELAAVDGVDGLDVSELDSALTTEDFQVNLVCLPNENLNRNGSCNSWANNLCAPEVCTTCGPGKMQPRQKWYRWRWCTDVGGTSFRQVQNYVVNLGGCSTNCQEP